ncbi:YeiH family protein [Komagataeibacter rhaeticus]|uniref:YeiH family protein n=1 Tax=Komagataeibacter rhaeticus TaxID=215221 RepID=UPI0006921771|nr:putative sulfate exporter family transporter [Komagataeibacter rhaeticus]GBQ13692.1 hypothetical protein AA16663_1545 [Komagataeibacter rhaeticus DSM 16663]
MIPHPCPRPAQAHLRRLLPGIALCASIAVLARGLEAAQIRLCGRVWLEALNTALLLGVGVRTCLRPGAVWVPGIKCCARTLLNVAIMCMGASFSMGAVLRAGPGLLAAVAGMVVFSLSFTCAVGWLVGLSATRTLLVACGNAICGNSAIMAAAPVIHAREEDVGATIAFTAAGGLVVVVGLPLLGPLLHLGGAAHGVLAGLTVYAVPQVMAAAAPFGPVAVQAGMLVKLMRVLMLGPVCAVLSVLRARMARTGPARGRVRVVPWYVTGFGAMMGLRAMGLLPPGMAAALAMMATGLTVLAMAALGLGVQAGAVLRAGRPLALTVVFSLLGLMGAALVLVRGMG